jgi:hypothetical protein
MTTSNPSYIPIQYPQHNFVQNAQVCITYISDVPLLSHISIQTLGGRDHEVCSIEHLPGIDSAGSYPAVNHADALPPTRYTNIIGNDDPPHVAIVSVNVHLSVVMPPLLTWLCRRALVNVNLTPIIPLRAGLFSIFQLTLVHLRSSSMLLRFLYVLSTPLSSLFTCSLSYCASNYRRCPTITLPVTCLFLTT